jgi:hypothetical protein
VRLKTGARLCSQVDSTEVLVIRAPADDVVLDCGGHPMIDLKVHATPGLSMPDEAADGTTVGKRYIRSQLDLEVLVTKPGQGALAVNGQPLEAKAATPLPASD